MVAFYVFFILNTKAMELVEKGAAKPSPVKINKQTGASNCGPSTNLPCFANLDSGKKLWFEFDISKWKIIIISALVDAFNVTIKGSMKTSEIAYTIKPSTPTTFTTLIAQFMPLKCTANVLAPIVGIIVTAICTIFC